MTANRGGPAGIQVRTLGDLERYPGTTAWTTVRALGVSPAGVHWLRHDQQAALRPSSSLPMRVRFELPGWQVWPLLGVDYPPCRKEPGWLPVAVVHEPVVPDDPVAALTEADREWLRAHGWSDMGD